MLKQIELSHDVHESKRVILIHHSDCGAYKLSYHFNSPKEEKEKQISDMIRIEKIIKERFPDMSVDKIWAELEGNNITFSKL